MSLICKNPKYRIFFTAALLFITLSFSMLFPSEQDKMTMNTPLSDRISELIPQEKSFFYSFNDETYHAISHKLIALTNTEGMILGAPDSADVNDANNILPLLWLQRFTSFRKWQVVKKRNSFVVFVNLQSDSIIFRNAYAGQPKRFNFSQIPFSSQGNPPTAAKGLMADIDMLDIRELLFNQISPSQYAITMTQYDWVSNTVHLQLIDSAKDAPEIPGIPAPVARQIVTTLNAAAAHADEASFFSPSLDPPQISTNGIFAVVPQKVTTSDTRWMVHGSIRVPVAPGAIVDNSSEKNTASGIPSAIITAMVILNKLDNREPATTSLKMPVYALCKAGDIVDVSFSADLKRLHGDLAAAGVYQIFIVCGAFVSGPFALAVTDDVKK